MVVSKKDKTPTFTTKTTANLPTRCSSAGNEPKSENCPV